MIAVEGSAFDIEQGPVEEMKFRSWMTCSLAEA